MNNFKMDKREILHYIFSGLHWENTGKTNRPT